MGWSGYNLRISVSVDAPAVAVAIPQSPTGPVIGASDGAFGCLTKSVRAEKTTSTKNGRHK